VISTVNLAEVLGGLCRSSAADLDAILGDLVDAGPAMVPFDLPQARLTAELVPQTQSAGLWLGDRACLALAVERGWPVLTANRAWAGLGLPVEVVVIR
jgi:ribonuclease VapC